jgi:hypothetical protein
LRGFNSINYLSKIAASFTHFRIEMVNLYVMPEMKGDYGLWVTPHPAQELLLNCIVTSETLNETTIEKL